MSKMRDMQPSQARDGYGGPIDSPISSLLLNNMVSKLVFLTFCKCLRDASLSLQNQNHNQKCFIWSVDQGILTKAKRPLALRPPIVNTG